MGIRKDLDRFHERYIYYLMHNEIVIYVGTSIKPITRYKQHLTKIKNNDTAPIYQYCIKNNIKPTLLIKSKVSGYYSDAEKIEIQHIELHKSTILNFYNNPLSPDKKKDEKKNRKEE